MHTHHDLDAKLNKWANEKDAYLKAIDTHKIVSVQGAQLQLSLLQAYNSEKADISGGDVQRLSALGNDIRQVRSSR